jgi:Zn-finger protein
VVEVDFEEGRLVRRNGPCRFVEDESSTCQCPQVLKATDAIRYIQSPTGIDIWSRYMISQESGVAKVNELLIPRCFDDNDGNVRFAQEGRSLSLVSLQ